MQCLWHITKLQIRDDSVIHSLSLSLYIYIGQKQLMSMDDVVSEQHVMIFTIMLHVEALGIFFDHFVTLVRRDRSMKAQVG